MTEHSEDFVMVEKSVVGGLTANVKRWRGRASAERLKRQRWRKRALAAEAEVERLREALLAVLPSRMGSTPDLAWPVGYVGDDPWQQWEDDVQAAVFGSTEGVSDGR